ncbi:MAG: hypothetical protein K8R54_14790 [Bacteroidales bacterium]|nr:hypothetical protein [Bacteroidales bacterium]
MSGPKSYKTYSINVFEGKLNDIFCMQSDIIQIFKELKNFSVNDNERNIKFNCDDFTDKNQDEVNKQIKSFVVEYKGRFGQEKYDEFNKKIKSKVKSLNKFLNKLKKEKTDFSEKREDYQSYISYEKYYENSLNSLKRFKTNVIDYLEQNIDDEHLKKFEKTKNTIKQFKPTIKKLNFEYGFQDIEKTNKQKVSKFITQSENKLGDFKNIIVKSIINESLSQKKQVPQAEQTKSVKQNKEIKNLTKKINEKINVLKDNKLRKKFISELNKLQKSKVLTDVYFYKEFLDNLKQSERTQEYKQEIKNFIYEINNTETASVLAEKRNKFLQTAIGLLELPVIKQYSLNDFKTRYRVLKEKNIEEIHDEYVRKKENEFLKSQLVNGLQNMNYQVADDMEVIDFEKQSDFLLKVPNQKNYINLRIGKDNTIAYNFLIEENKDSLSIDQKRKKVTEMESACKGFKQVLEDLEKMGLKVNQTNDNAATEETIMQLPKKYRDKIKSEEKQKQRLQQTEKKKKYLG